MANPLKADRREGFAALPQTPQEWADRGNAYLRGEITGIKDGKFIPRTRNDVEWVVQGGKCVIRWKAIVTVDRRSVMDRRGQPMSEADTTELNVLLDHLGANARYRPDGSRYLVDERDA